MNDRSILLLMLEDESDRLQRFESVLLSHDYPVEFVHRRTAPDFIDIFHLLHKSPTLICLDHDLFTDSPDDPDPGDGRDVTSFLTQQTPCCPVLIHSSNAPAATSMFFALEGSNWNVERIAPIGEDWIESYWWHHAKPHLTG